MYMSRCRPRRRHEELRLYIQGRGQRRDPEQHAQPAERPNAEPTRTTKHPTDDHQNPSTSFLGEVKPNSVLPTGLAPVLATGEGSTGGADGAWRLRLAKWGV